MKKILLPVLFAKADEKIDGQLRRFKNMRKHMAIVVDRKNIPTGLITLEDILEELVGSIQDEHDQDAPAPRFKLAQTRVRSAFILIMSVMVHFEFPPHKRFRADRIKA